MPVTGYTSTLNLVFEYSLLIPIADNPIIGGDPGTSCEYAGFSCDSEDASRRFECWVRHRNSFADYTPAFCRRLWHSGVSYPPQETRGCFRTCCRISGGAYYRECRIKTGPVVRPGPRNSLPVLARNLGARAGHPVSRWGDAIERGTGEALPRLRMPSKSLCIGMQKPARQEARESDASTVRVGCRA